MLFDPFPDPPAESGDLGSDGMEGEPLDMRIVLWSKHKHEVCRDPVVHGGVTKRSAFQAEGFTHQPPDPVAPDGVEPLVGDRITCAKDRVLRGFQEEETLQEGPIDPAAACKDTVKTPAAPEPAFAFHLPFVTDRQLLAPTGTAA